VDRFLTAFAACHAPTNIRTTLMSMAPLKRAARKPHQSQDQRCALLAFAPG